MRIVILTRSIYIVLLGNVLFVIFIVSSLKLKLLHHNYDVEFETCLNEEFSNDWELLENILSLRRNSTFYFPSENKIRFLMMAKINESYNLRYYAMVSNKHDQSKFKYIELSYELDKLVTNGQYASFVVDATLNEADVLEISETSENASIHLIVKNHKFNIEIKRPLEAKIKLPLKSQKNLALCTKTLRLNNEAFVAFTKWIDINRQLGFDRVILYNHSIDTQPYTDYFESLKGFVEVRRYRYYTYLDMARNLTENKFDDVRRMHERIALNDCFLSNLYNYKYIAIYDIDEILLPRRYRFIDQDNFTTKLNKTLNGFNEANCKFDFNSYLADIVREKIVPDGFYTAWFQYAHFLPKIHAKLVFDRIRQSLNSNGIDFKSTLNVSITLKCDDQHNKNITFQINSTGDYEYAKQLLDFYEKYIENDALFKIYNKTLDDIFNRVFMVIGSKFHQEGYGKSIHGAHHAFKIGHHEGFNADSRFLIPFKIGYVSHYRDCLFHNDTARFFSINQIKLDFQTIECFN